jgi:hypothetical protein
MVQGDRHVSLPQDQSLGSSGFLAIVAALICGGVLLELWSQPGHVLAVPRGSPQDLALEWHGPPFASNVPWRNRDRSVWASDDDSQPRRERPPTTRPRGSPHPAGLNHAAIDQSKPRRRKHVGATLGEDLFVPKQLGWPSAWDLCARHLC